MTVTGLTFMVAFLTLLALAFIRNPMFGLYAYIADFYIHPESRWWGHFLPDLRWSFLAAFVTIVAIWLRAPPPAGNRQIWYQTAPAKLMILFVAWFWFTYLWALEPSLHIAAGVLLTKYVLLFYMVYRIVDTPGKMTAFLMAHVAGCFYLGFLGFGSDPSERLDGVGGPGIDDSNTLSMHLATGVVAGAMLVLHLKDWRRYFCIVALAFAMNAIVLCGSRGAFLGLVAGGLMLYYLRPVAYKKMFYVYAVLGVLLFLRLASDQFWHRMDSVEVAASGDTQELDVSAYSRIAMAEAQLQMFKLYPMGTGHRGSEYLSRRFLAPEYWSSGGGARSSHNVFLTVLVEQGIPGAVIFIVLIVWTGKALRRLKRETAVRDPTPEQIDRAVLSAAVGGGLLVVLIAGLFADFSKCEVQIWLMALLASLLQQPAAARAEVPAPGLPKLATGYPARPA